MTTPEGKVKKQVRKVLDKYPHWGFWPVPSGFGKGSLDYIGCINGKFFSIETKAAGKDYTDLQRVTAEQIQWHGGKVFKIVGLDAPELEELDAYLDINSAIASRK